MCLFLCSCEAVGSDNILQRAPATHRRLIISDSPSAQTGLAVQTALGDGGGGEAWGEGASPAARGGHMQGGRRQDAGGRRQDGVILTFSSCKS